VVIAGASRGIGRSLAKAFASSGAKVALLARGDLKGLEAELAGQAEVMALRCDVADWASVRDAAAAVESRWGRAHVLVNTAAVLGATGPLWESDPEVWKQGIDVNLLGSYHAMRAFLPKMIEARQGKVINFAGGGAAYAYPMFSSYGAAKAAIVRLTETVAVEAAPFGVQVNVVAPGAIDTDLLRAVQAAGGEVRTFGSIDLVIDVVKFLASRNSDHIGGRFIHARDSYKDWRELRPDDYTLRRVENR
jgi:NAD(P)-dependent dehydrogenase (short-subunit alcohol dehydrogenase family)